MTFIDFPQLEQVLFSNPELLETVTYVRPPSLTFDSSTVEPTETRANCQSFLATDKVSGIGPAARTYRQFKIRASELSSILLIGNPRKGDFIIDLDGDRYDVHAALPVCGGRVWQLDATKTNAEDCGAIALAHTEAEDRGDLTSTTSAEDYGPLYL
jgi:hypothetical protein